MDEYINAIELQPPSPRAEPLDLYLGDYTGSPFSSHSDLSSYAENQLGPIFDSYDPHDYDGPNSAGSLLMFNEYDSYYRSPSPSGSDNNDDNRSRASSASSTHTTFQNSPHMGVAQSFESLSFSSPNWSTEPLPPHKAPSPPRLQIDHQPPIIINAPEDQDNNDIGPQLHIVPATPISGGAGVVNIASSSPWLEPHSNSNVSSRSPSPAHSTPGPSRSPSMSPQPPSQTLLYPQQPRIRSKSDTSLEPPNWDTIVPAENLVQHQVYPPTLGSNFTFGGPPQPQNANTNQRSDFLSPNNNFDFQNGTQLRRSRSDTGNMPLNRHRGSRSEDFRFTATPNDDFLTVNNNTNSSQLFPPSSHDSFIRHQQQQQQQQIQHTPQFLSPAHVRVPELLPSHPTHHHSSSLGSATIPRGHYRSASGGSRPRNERGAAVWDAGLDVVSTSNRVSPYPSPHASPRGRLLPLEREDGFEFAGSIAAESGSQNEENGMGLGIVGAVSKPNVTTGRTANASQRRRKQEATFVCPVQGCGSTFTRSFNLKGHIRSHNEEKPFQCKWPGCGKGFARQHDCKRHEQLHTNYRPFNCEGCGKQFARMDALNRHLRSEGGSECNKQQQQQQDLSGTASPPDSANSNRSLGASPPASEPEAALTMEEYAQYGVGVGQVKVKQDEALGWGVGLSVAL